MRANVGDTNLGRGAWRAIFTVSLCLFARPGTSLLLRGRWRFHGFRRGPQSGSRNPPRPHPGQTSPNKNMNFRCTTAAFTLPPAPGGLRHLVLTRPGTEPSMRFLSVGSHLCARASSRHPLAGLPLPSASSYIGPKGHLRYSYRGLAPHKFMPMSGVPQYVNGTGLLRCASQTGPLRQRYVPKDAT